MPHGAPEGIQFSAVGFFRSNRLIVKRLPDLHQPTCPIPKNAVWLLGRPRARAGPGSPCTPDPLSPRDPIAAPPVLVIGLLYLTLGQRASRLFALKAAQRPTQLGLVLLEALVLAGFVLHGWLQQGKADPCQVCVSFWTPMFWCPVSPILAATLVASSGRGGRVPLRSCCRATFSTE
jgi:hypothetical protein